MHPNDLTLQAYVDGELGTTARAEVNDHVAGCPGCRQLVAEMTLIRSATAALERIDAPAHAWQAIAAELHAGRRAKRQTRWALGLAVAATVTFLAAIGWSRWPLLPRTDRTASSDLAFVQSELQEAEDHYQKAIVGLEAIARNEATVLDPKIAETLTANLQLVDRAIVESRAAVNAQPDNPLARQSLLDALRTKLGLLEDTVAAINEARPKG